MKISFENDKDASLISIGLSHSIVATMVFLVVQKKKSEQRIKDVVQELYPAFGIW